jgi:sister-chromatid-cohesion protein PDS5
MSKASASAKASAKSDLYKDIILVKYSKKADLLKYLYELHNSLARLNQDAAQRPKGLESISNQLIDPKILNHSDKDVRLLTSCCLVDILRIFAPEAPFGDEEMVRVFEVIITQLRGLSNYEKDSSVGRQILYILTMLSTVKSCVVPVMLAQNGVHGAEEVAISMFDAILSSVRTDHSSDSKFRPFFYPFL